jgi:prepilin-type N-terminal cleavage/methylation domain-containing protein
MKFRPSHFSQSAFTLVEVAISLAIIGIALVAIIGVLPLGMNVQRDNREGTIINQDATVFIEAIRNGSRGLDDLTNYVYAITNYWTEFDNNGKVINGGGAVNNGYTYNNSSVTWPLPSGFSAITNGLRVIGLLSTPEFTDNLGNPINSLSGGGYSNHILATVRSISGPAVEKPPQDNDIIQADSFGYRLYCVNAPVAAEIPPLWNSKSYNTGDQVYYNGIVWQATATTISSDTPGNGSPTPWTQNLYANQLAANLHELRLTFLWPVLPNGHLGTGRQTYRALIGGQIAQTNYFGQILYFYKPQNFTNAP